jgi:flagellar basal-body rod protein FlgC
MSSMWSAIDIAGTGVNVDQTWIDTISGNIANMNDAVTPGQPVYRAESIVVGASVQPSNSSTPGAGAGVQVNAITLGSSAGVIQHDPSNPIANAQGDVVYPVVDLGSQMTDLVQAQTSYQANAKVMADSKTAYEAILSIKA